jgi:quercetin dioxygenase-like cupin family protein
MTKLKFLLCLSLMLSTWTVADDDRGGKRDARNHDNWHHKTDNYRYDSQDDDKDIEVVQVETLAKTSSSWDGDMLPFYPETEPEITILRIKIPAGFKLPIHKHPVINAGVLLKGELTVLTEDENESLHLEAGDSIVELVNKWHFGFNMGDETAELIVFYVGTPGTPITITQ